MHQDFLSDIELYYTGNASLSDNAITLTGDEAHHAANVMRHKAGDIIFATDGKGKIFKSEITVTGKSNINLKIISSTEYKNELAGFTFCIPRLKSRERFEFALEKCIEIGITNFIIFESDRTVSKGDKTDKWSKLGISAMKQSLRPFLPEFKFEKNVDDILKKYSSGGGKVYLFDQNGQALFRDCTGALKGENGINYFIFGPEGGISEREMELMKGCETFKLTGNRLRSETAIISAAILLTE